MITFELSRRGIATEAPEGFDLGDLTITGENGVVTSAPVLSRSPPAC